MRKSILMLLAVAVAVGCTLKNDMSYPIVKGDILAFEVEDAKSVRIIPDSLLVSIVLEESADIKCVPFKGMTLSNDTQCNVEFGDNLDLSDTIKMTLSTYQDYVWKIVATQPVSRVVKVDGMVGEAKIFPNNHMVNITVTPDTDLHSVTFREMKLELEGSVITATSGYEFDDSYSKVYKTREVNLPQVLDMEMSRTFVVEHRGVSTEWDVVVQHQKILIELCSVNPWCYSADLTGLYKGTGTPIIEYRKSGDSDWLESSEIDAEGTSLYGTLTQLQPQTTYEVRLVNGDDVSEVKSFTTSDATALPNGSFDEWNNGGYWIPNASATDIYWDTANGGTDMAGVHPTSPESTIVVSGKAARLETKFVDLFGIRKLAAGNIYTGKFKSVDIANMGAVLEWGQPFSSKPKALKGYYHYLPKTIDVAQSPYADMMGKGDVCQIQIILCDWSAPYEIITAKSKFLDVESDPSVIAHGVLESSDATDGYKEFKIDIKYRDNRTPKYIVVMACSSKYGDYFTGAKGSVLYVDEFELVYD